MGVLSNFESGLGPWMVNGSKAQLTFFCEFPDFAPLFFLYFLSGPFSSWPIFFLARSPSFFSFSPLARPIFSFWLGYLVFLALTVFSLLLCILFCCFFISFSASLSCFLSFLLFYFFFTAERATEMGRRRVWTATA
jgi:hypothetical protein